MGLKPGLAVFFQLHHTTCLPPFVFPLRLKRERQQKLCFISVFIIVFMFSFSIPLEYIDMYIDTYIHICM